MTSFVRWRPRDAGLLSLRRACRAALLMPALFAATLLGLHNVQLTTFAAFGTFALLVLGDFAGPDRDRAGAYAATSAIGAALVAIGTLAGLVPWVAAVVMFIVAFCIQFAGVFGSYAAAAQVALQLAFVLAVSVPAPPAAVPARLAGWLLASAVATAGAFALWPHHERQELRERAAAACRALADLVEAHRVRAGGETVERRERAAQRTVRTVRDEYAATPLRPAGPTRRDRAFAELVAELDRGLTYAARRAHEGFDADPHIGQEEALEEALAGSLRQAGAALRGGPVPDLAALDRAKQRQREALERWAAGTLGEGGAPEAVLAGLRAGYRLRILTYVAMALGANAAIVTGRQPADGVRLPAGTPRLTGVRGAATRVINTARTDLTPGSSVFHNCLRAAIGLSLAVLLARLLGLEHAFWAVLGAMSVLRSNALATGRTTLQALAGTFAGFAVGAVFTVLVGDHQVALWIALPIAVFLAAYTPTTVHFVVGQAAFTVLVMILFNLIAPAGWTVGLVRIEDIAIGTGVSVAAGLLLWPRGARADFRRALAQLYRAVAAHLAGCLHPLLGRDAEIPVAGRAAVVRARDRAGEAFDLLLTERSVHRAGFEVPALLVAAGSSAILVGDLLDVLAARGYSAARCTAGAAAVDDQVRLMLAGLLNLADRLDERPAAPVEPVSASALREAAAGCLGEWAADLAGPAAAERAALTVTYCAELVEQLSGLIADLSAPVDRALAAARIPWWR